MARCLRSAEYVNARDLAVRYEPFSGDRERGIAPLNMRATLMVVDDIGTERRNADGRRDSRFMPALADVIDSRQRRQTILTTNLTARRFVETYCDERMSSRLREIAQIVGCGSQDLRRGA